MTKRLFAAIKINLEKKLTKAIDKIRLSLADEKIKWEETNNLHITLHFFDDAPINEIDRINKLFSFSVKYSGIRF